MRTLVENSLEATLLDIINTNEAATAAELREIVFGKPNKRRKPGDIVESLEYQKPRRQVLEAPLQKLQMGGRLLIADFQHKMTRQGERYGWGVALYTTPEIWFGKGITRCDHTPEESFNILVDHLASRLPYADRRQIVKLLS